MALAAITSVAFAGKEPEPEPVLIFEPGGPENSAIESAALSAARVTTRDVGERLFRMRAGLRPMEHKGQEEVAPAAGSKGGIVTSRTVSSMNCWEIYGSLFGYIEEQDLQVQPLPGVVGGPGVRFLLTHPTTDVEIFGGNIGIERHFNENWSAGLALGASTTDIDMSPFGSADIDTFAVTPYISFYQADALGAADFWADLMYSHGFNEYKIGRAMGSGPFYVPSPEGDTNQLEFTTGLNFGSENLSHGPYAGLRWIDGNIDSYNDGLAFPEQDLESLASVLGYQVSVPIQTSAGTLVPQIRAAWEHEFEDDSNSLFGLPLGERDEETGVFGAGIGYYFNSGWNTVLDYEARLGSEINGHYVSMKVGKEF
jgi:hypothetical protein